MSRKGVIRAWGLEEETASVNLALGFSITSWLNKPAWGHLIYSIYQLP